MNDAWDSLPDWLRSKIQGDHAIEELASMLGMPIPEMATDAEVCACLYLSSLAAPLSHDAGEIYFFLATGLLNEQKMAVPPEAKVTVLNKDQERELEEYRRTIYRRRGKIETDISRAFKTVFMKAGKRAGKSVDQMEDTWQGKTTGGDTQQRFDALTT